jgi:hypothetical protein
VPLTTDASVRLSRAARQWEQRLPRRATEVLAGDRPTQLVVSVRGKQPELVHLLATAEGVLAEHGYQLDRTEKPYDATRGVLVYAVFVRPRDLAERSTTGWLG